MSRIITPADIAARIHVTVKYVRELCERGEIPARKVGKYWRVEEADFEKWWSDGKTAPVVDTKVVTITRGARR